MTNMQQRKITLEGTLPKESEGGGIDLMLASSPRPPLTLKGQGEPGDEANVMSLGRRLL